VRVKIYQVRSAPSPDRHAIDLSPEGRGEPRPWLLLRYKHNTLCSR
jgi:hypothetical protein